MSGVFGRKGSRAGGIPGPMRIAVSVLALAFLAGGPAAAQDLADYDYENLGFRGVGLETGYIFPTTVEETYTVGARMDLGYLGPGFRIVPSINYWSSDLKRGEVEELERRLEDLIARETGAPAPPVELGSIQWTDLSLGVDGHLVWSIPFGFLGYGGVGAAAHLMNGSGSSIEDTFIEDLLDSVRAGFNLHLGLERALHDRVRIYSTGRYELLGDLRYFEVRAGLQLFFGEPEPGERPR